MAITGKISKEMKTSEPKLSHGSAGCVFVTHDLASMGRENRNRLLRSLLGPRCL
jgi:hypothetical protein